MTVQKAKFKVGDIVSINYPEPVKENYIKETGKNISFYEMTGSVIEVCPDHTMKSLAIKERVYVLRLFTGNEIEVFESQLFLG